MPGRLLNLIYERTFIMFKFSSLNKNASFTFKPDPTAQYVKLSELLAANDGDLDTVYTVRALYLNNKSKFGLQCSAALDDVLVNLPAHKVDDVQEIIADPAAVELINEGRCGFKIRPYVDNNKVDRLTIDWVDIKL